MGHLIDARGLRCPIPVLKAEKHLEGLQFGQTLVLLCDDPIARIDIPVLCKRNAWTFAMTQDGDTLHFRITK